MLLKAGIAMILFSLTLTAVTVTAVSLRSGSSTEPVLPAEPRAAEVKQAEVKQAEEPKFDLGEILEIGDEEPAVESTGELAGEPQPEPQVRESSPKPSPESPPDEATPDSAQTEKPASGEPRAERSRSESGASSRDPLSGGPLPTSEIPDWPRPTSDEVASAEEPRYYETTLDTSMSLTIEALGLYDVPVISSYGYEILDRGLMHEPDTSFPWDSGAQRNVYVAGHYLGWPGTASHLVFYNLDKLENDDEIILEDSQGTDYRYRVSESFMAEPDESWVMGQERNRDMLTLQTCIPPTFEDRLVVRADRS